jgi:hypothetical protein
MLPTADLPSSNEVGSLGVVHLKRLLARLNSARNGQMANRDFSAEKPVDDILLAGLELGLEETWRYVFEEQPTLERFEQWVLEKNDGSIEEARIRRINAAIMGLDYYEDIKEWLRGIENEAPVLSETDLAFWEENGYVIVRQAVSKENSREAELAIWAHLQMNPAESETWYSKRLGQGIMVQFFHHRAFSANRRSRRIHKAFAQLWGTADLWMNTDRVGFNPPERSGWSFQGPRLHWDTSLEQPIKFGVQGILYLTDTLAEQGAFTCVPGFHRRIGGWLNSLPAGADPRDQDLERLGAVPIPAGAGDLIIWREDLPHGSRPNHAQQPRIVQYIKMFPLRVEQPANWI